MKQSVISETQVLFRERVLPGVSFFLVLQVIGPSVGVALWPVNPVLAVSCGIVAAMAATGLAFASSPIIEVRKTDQGSLLKVRGARLPLRFIQNAELIPSERKPVERGPALNANAFTVFQLGASDLVKVYLNDPNDPAPYWLFSSRKGEELSRVLSAGKL